MANIQGMTDWESLRKALGGAVGKEFNAAKLTEAIKERVFGQDATVDEIGMQMKHCMEKAQVTGRLKRPLGLFLLAGPARTGKSLLFTVLGEYMYEGKAHVQRLDMGNFAQPGAQGALFGAPEGAVGGKGSLTSALSQNSRTIFELANFEKTHPEIARQLAEGWKLGYFIDARTQERVLCSESFFFLTTASAAEQLTQISANFKDNALDRQDAIASALTQSGFSPDLIERIDYTFVFEPLSLESYALMAEAEISQVVSTYGLQLARIDEEYLYGLVTDEASRPNILRDLRRRLEIELGAQFLQLRRQGAKTVAIMAVNGRPKVQDGGSLPLA